MTEGTGTARLILCVDDEQETRVFFRERLRGYQVLTAASGSAALAIARKIPVDVYLVSARVPDFFEADLCRALRRFDRKTPIISYAPDGLDGASERMLSAGAHAHLLQPLDIERLETVIESALRDLWIESMAARIAEHAAVLEELNARSALVRAREADTWQQSERIRNRLLRIKAYRAFIEAGGVRANFTRIWPDMAHAFRVSDR